MKYFEAIKKLRKKMILTQTEFAEMFKVSFGTVNRWESGKYQPTIKTKRKLQPFFDKYNINVDEEIL